MKFCIVTLGCKVNQYESRAIESILISRGHTPAQAGTGCDACVINTCAVTAESERKSRQAARAMKKAEPKAIIALCGCLAELDAAAAQRLGADLTGGSGERLAFIDKLEMAVSERRGSKNRGAADDAGVLEEPAGEDTELGAGAAISCGANGGAGGAGKLAGRTRKPGFEELPPGSSARRTRALLKIQDGCDNFCAYCVIPYARGRSVSLPPERAAEYAAQLERRGFREIVVTGIEISSYGYDLGGTPALTDVLKSIGISAPGARLRLGSLDPGAISARFCDELLALPNICRHFHLSLQSGCDATLRSMGRKYGAQEAAEAIARLRAGYPGCGITADLITGFPGETDAQFEETMAFIEEAGFSGMHIFPFSPRPGTRAAAMEGQVGKKTARDRARAAAGLAGDMAEAFRKSLVGERLEVLFERERGGLVTGHSDNYVEVAVEKGAVRNDLRSVLVISAEDGLVMAEIV